MRGPRIDPALAGIVRSLRARAGGMVVLEEAESVPWASLTFAGARHLVALRCADAATARALAGGLDQHEFTLSGHIVADLAKIEIEDDLLRFEALTLVDD